MKPKVNRLIEQELFRRAAILVEARRITLAEHLLIEKGPEDDGGEDDEKKAKLKAIKQQIRDLIQQAEDAGDEGDEKTNEKLLKRAEDLAKANGLKLNDIKAKVKPTPKPEPDDEEEPEPKDGDGDDEDEPEPKKTAVGGVADKADDEDQDDYTGFNNYDDDDEDAPPMPKDGTADDDIKKGEVTYKIAGKKPGEFEIKAIPSQWFQQWLEREKFGPAELKAKLANAQHTSRELTPPRTDDRDKLNNFRERQSGYQNKIKAIQNVLRSLQKVHNKDIDDHNKKQERRKDRINTLVDTLSDGNPLMKVIVGLLADKLLKNKEKVNYTGDEDPYGDD